MGEVNHWKMTADLIMVSILRVDCTFSLTKSRTSFFIIDYIYIFFLSQSFIVIFLRIKTILLVRYIVK